ncbi:hypothetical protein N9V40_01250 [Pseudomonadales bacterium]|jgi:hypothetical protein|nr:hypothetical protein [Pseudomonadales bacterium]
MKPKTKVEKQNDVVEQRMGALMRFQDFIEDRDFRLWEEDPKEQLIERFKDRETINEELPPATEYFVKALLETKDTSLTHKIIKTCELDYPRTITATYTVPDGMDEEEFFDLLMSGGAEKIVEYEGEDREEDYNHLHFNEYLVFQLNPMFCELYSLKAAMNEEKEAA